MAQVDESDLSEITILPDGRIYAFGITRSIKEILHSLQSREGALAAQGAVACLEVSAVQKEDS